MSEARASIVREPARTADSILEQLGGTELPDRIELRGLVVAAHPDDEIIGFGARLARWSNAEVVYTTDGAPDDMRDAHRLGLATRDEYVALRRAERGRALALASVADDRVHDLGRTDSEGSRDLVGLAADLCAILHAASPEVVVTHPYEGGHPDHDATAFAVHAAVGLLGVSDARTPAIVEMTSYHLGPTGLTTGCFLRSTERPRQATKLGEADRALKKRMLDCHTSQLDVLSRFQCEGEPIRLAPVYDFGAPPHEGQLFYECFPWWATGVEWRSRARVALRALGLTRFGGLPS